jgi:mannitol/fructose-specific phosphotransferase system IIA component
MVSGEREEVVLAQRSRDGIFIPHGTMRRIENVAKRSM